MVSAAPDHLDPRLPRIVVRPSELRAAGLVARLRAEVEALSAMVEARDEEISRLKGPVGRLVAAAPALGLTPRQAEFLALFFRSDFVTPERVEAALYGLADRVPERSLYKVMIHHMRRRLAFLEVRIETIQARGWWMGPQSRAAIVAHLERVGR